MKLGRAILTTTGVVAALLVFVGCQNSKTSGSGDAAMSVNKTCPVKGGPVDQSLSTNYKGQKVAFCCGGCETSFEKMTDAQKDAALAKVK